ncbi:hypothetical protein V7S43_010572 [Phytophthora oleae]|uniref:RxLR effector protein n=1 Tax=Phytophthora oleae TaxID=2107226 RepID=A0ABD3FBY9_9STRA
MRLSAIFAFAVIYCTNVEASNLRRFLEASDSGSSDFLDEEPDFSDLQEIATSTDGSSVLDNDGEPSNSGFVDASEDGSTFRLLEETGSSVAILDESSSNSEDDVGSVYQPGTVKPASFDASSTFDRSGALW